MSKLRYWISPYVTKDFFNFYNPLLFSLHPTSLSKWKSQLIILKCPAMIQRAPGGRLQVAVRSPLGDFPCLGCRQITPGSPSSVPTENGGCPCGHLWCFFRQLHPQFPRVAEQRPAGDWAAPCGTPANELICVTSADHPAKFNWELKCSGRHRMSEGWALQECLFGRRPPDFCRIWCKTRRTVIGRSIFLYCDVAIRTGGHNQSNTSEKQGRLHFFSAWYFHSLSICAMKKRKFESILFTTACSFISLNCAIWPGSRTVNWKEGKI